MFQLTCLNCVYRMVPARSVPRRSRLEEGHRAVARVDREDVARRVVRQADNLICYCFPSSVFVDYLFVCVRLLCYIVYVADSFDKPMTLLHMCIRACRSGTLHKYLRNTCRV